MMSCEPQFLLDSTDLDEGQFREARMEHQGRPIWLIVTRQSGRIRAWFNVCPHQGRNLNYAPDKFLIDPEGRLVCAAHGAVFEPDSGICSDGPCRGASLKPVETFEQDGIIRGRISNQALPDE